MVKDKEEEINFSVKEKLLKYLIENKVPQSILAVSRAIGVDYKNTHDIVNRLHPDIILKNKIGNTTLIEAKLAPSQEIFSVENKRRMQFLKENRQLELARQDIDSLNYPFLIALIFGSYAKGLQTKKSDIDVCIICDNKEKTKDLISKLELLPIKLEIHYFTTEEFEKMLKTNEKNVGKEIIKRNIILYGIENYYNLISKWMKKE